MAPPVEDPFRPFVAADDGTLLVLRRRRTLGDRVLRAALSMLLLPFLGLFALIPYAAWTRSEGIFGWLGAGGLLLLLWFLWRLVLLGFRLEGVRGLTIGPGSLVLDARGALLRRQERVAGVVALAARTVTTSTEYGEVRWLRLRARTADGHTDLGYLALDARAEPAREAAARAAASTIAARLGVPLELDVSA